MATTHLDITHNALERFIKLVRPDLDMIGARELLEGCLLGASPMRQRSMDGDSLWRMEDPPCVLVVKRGRRPTDHGRQVVVTVLPGGWNRTRQVYFEPPEPELPLQEFLTSEPLLFEPLLPEPSNPPPQRRPPRRYVPLWMALSRMLELLRRKQVDGQLSEAVQRLVILTAESPIRDWPGALLLRGFERLAAAVPDQPKKQIKLTKMCEALRQVMPNAPHPPLRAVLTLWKEVIRLTREAARDKERTQQDRHAWSLSTSAWCQGLITLKRGPLPMKETRGRLNPQPSAE